MSYCPLRTSYHTFIARVDMPSFIVLYLVSGAEPTPTPAPVQQKTVASATQLKQQEILKQVTEQPFIQKDPPPDYEFMADPPSISALDL